MQAMLTEGLGRVGAHIWTLSKNGTNRGWMRLDQAPSELRIILVGRHHPLTRNRAAPHRARTTLHADTPNRIPRYCIPGPPFARANEHLQQAVACCRTCLERA